MINLRENEFYYPFCNEKGCDGCLQIGINEYNFTVKSICEKNKNHKKKGMIFQTFENFHLKEKKYLKCFKCNFNIDNNEIYKCKECNQIYCIKCFIKDDHIEKNLNNLLINSNKCQKCNKELIKYCIDCGEKICLFCLKNSPNSIHNNHEVEYILESLPSNKQIDNINNKLNQKIKYINELIDLIENWFSALSKKVDKLKQNLKNEMNFIEKFFKNFNPHFVNYIYYKNFNNFNQGTCIVANKFLSKFKNSIEFEEKTKNLFEALFYNKSKTENKNGVLKYEGDLENGLVSHLDEQNFLIHYDRSQYFDINYYNQENKHICYFKETRVDIKDKIYSISYSKIKNKIYICLKDHKIIKIYDYIKEGTSKNEINECIEEIKDNNNLDGHYNKCIYLNNDYLAVADDDKISIWHENLNEFSNYYSNITNIPLNSEIDDLLLLNTDYFCASQSSNHSIVFCDTNNFTKEKSIMKINCVNTFNCLFLVKKYLIANCFDGIAVISTKTKELVQFIQNFNDKKNKKICVGDGSLYILDYNNYNLLILKMKLYNGSFVVTKNYKLLNKENERDDISLKKLIELYNANKLGILFTNKAIIIVEKNIYILREDNNLK
jgi:hypothetical protein